MPATAPPKPAGATSRQAHEAERYQARYGPVRARVTTAGTLLVDVLGHRGTFPWATLELAPSGKRLTILYHDGDPRERAITPSQRRVLAELRETPALYRSPAQLALTLDLSDSYVGQILRGLHERGLVDEHEDRGAGRRFRAAPERI